MSIIKDILNEELERLNSLAEAYREEMRSLPKGSLSVKVIRGKRYCYRAYREKQRVKFEYLGKDDSKGVKEIREKLARRKDLSSRLKQIGADLKELARAVHGSRKTPV